MGNQRSGQSRIEGIQSVDRAVAVLDYLGRHGDGNVSDIAEQLGVHKSTASRMLTALQTHGLVEATTLRGRYKLGYGLVRLAGQVGARLDVVAQGSPVCDALAARSGETVTLTVARDRLAITIHQARSLTSSITVETWIGRPTPLHATASGKVLLTWVPGEPTAGVLAGPLQSYTHRTLTDPRRLEHELDEVRLSGYALAPDEYETGLSAVAAPVFASDDTVSCALAVSGPTARIDRGLRAGLADDVCAAAREISRRMGHG